MNILVINAGSSSLKYQLMDPKSGSVMAKGLCERINLDGRLTHKVPARDLKVTREIPMPFRTETVQMFQNQREKIILGEFNSPRLR